MLSLLLHIRSREARRFLMLLTGGKSCDVPNVVTDNARVTLLIRFWVWLRQSGQLVYSV